MSCAALGLVSNIFVFEEEKGTTNGFFRMWLFTTGFLSIIVVLGLIIKYLTDSFLKTSIPSKIVNALVSVQLRIEHRFKGNLTDEEYHNAQISITTLAIIVLTIGVLFTLGVWTLGAVAILMGLSLCRLIFISFTRTKQYGYIGLIGWAVAGFCFAGAVRIYLSFP